MRKLIVFALSLLALAGCFAAPLEDDQVGSTEPSPAAKRAPAPALEGATLLADVSVSPTHTLYFYEGADSEGLVAESFNLDADQSVLKGHPLLEESGHFADLYQEFAGEAAVTEVVERMQALDARALAVLAAAGPEDPTPGAETGFPGPRSIASGENVEKDFWSEDADWFRINMCGGCVGAEGTRQNFGEPASWPTCTNNPDMCAFFGAGSFAYTRKSKNWNFTAANFASAGTMEMLAHLTDPREHCTWAQIVWSNCGAGGTRLLQQFVQPRSWFGITGTNSSTSWTRTFTTNQPGNIGFKVDVF